jgi:hypothetical protein
LVIGGMAENVGTEAKPQVVIKPYKNLFHLVYVFGLALLVGAVSCATYWNENHLIALLFLASFPALALIYELPIRGWGRGQTAEFVLGCFVLAWIIFQMVGPNPPIETDSEIYLVPGNKSTPESPCGNYKPPKGTIAFFVGSNEFWSSGGETHVITLDGKPVVTMKRSERGLLFDIEMFDLTRKLVAKLKNNKSILVPKNYNHKERSPDLSTLTLYDDYDKEILYVEFLNDKTVLIRGVFTGPNGTTIVVDDDQILRSIRVPGDSKNCGANESEGYSLSGLHATLGR